MYTDRGGIATMLNRDRYEPKRVAVEVVGTLDPNRHSQMDILSGGVSRRQWIH